jgi:hypothetical protein
MDEEQGRTGDAICRLRERVRWRPGKSTQHLAKRIKLGHIPVGKPWQNLKASSSASYTPRQPRCSSTAGVTPSPRP